MVGGSSLPRVSRARVRTTETGRDRSFEGYSARTSDLHDVNNGPGAVVSHRYRCVFIHIRKNAGSSIVNSFPADADDEAGCGYGTDGTFDPGWSSARYPGYLVFAVVRNPWSRFISGWKWLCRRDYEGKGNLGAQYYRQTGLAQLLRELPGTLPKRSHDRRHLLWSQLDMLTDLDGRFVADFVIRYENLEADYKLLCDRIGKADSSLPHRNRGTNRPYWHYFDDESRSRLAELFSNDIERFGYKFGDPG
jgi:chondroitin 4-sulfotransferase 11